MCGTPTSEAAVLEDSRFARRWWRVSRVMIGQVFSERNDIQRHPRTQICGRIKWNEIQRVRRFRPRSELVAPFPEVPLLSRPSFFEQSSQNQVGGRGFATFTQGRWNCSIVSIASRVHRTTYPLVGAVCAVIASNHLNECTISSGRK